ncbi:unnamed protein product [Mortierella alpina]
MGIAGLWQKLKTNGLDPQPTLPSDLADVFYEVDLQGCFFSVIKTMFMDEDSKPGSAHRVGVRLAHKMKAVFGDARLCVHVDGGSAQEKAYAANKRAKTRTTDMAKLDKELDKLQAKSEMGKWTSTTAMNFINRNINKLFVLTPADKEAMRDGLETSGVPVCLCQTEVDVCIARGPDKDVDDGPCRKRIAVSIDSDLLVYESISAVLRPMPKHNGYGLYVKSDVLRALDLPSARHMAVYGIVNENDYGRNVQHLGLARNLDIVRTLPSEGLSEMLEAYSRLASRATGELVDPHRFHLAHSVFGNHQQHLIEGRSPTNDTYRPYRQRFEHLKSLRLTRKPDPTTR